MFQNEYRQVNENSKFTADFGITRGYQSSITGSKRNSIGHLFASYDKDFQLKNFEKSEMKINIESVSNDTFLSVFQNNLIKSNVKPNSTSSLKSGINFILDKEIFNFSTVLKYTRIYQVQIVIDMNIIFQIIIFLQVFLLIYLMDHLIFPPLALMF